MRHRRTHDLRRRFISLARGDGAGKDILRRGTHQAPKDVMELYTEVEWGKLCEEVEKLKLPLQLPGNTRSAGRAAGGLGTQLGTHERLRPENQDVVKWRRRESNRADTVRQTTGSDREESLTRGNDGVPGSVEGTKAPCESEHGEMDCTKCTREQPGDTSGEPQVRQFSVADIVLAALTELDRGEAEAVRALLCRALAALDEPEAG